jgi:hypothetical protein
MRLTLVEHSYKQFTLSDDGKTLISEASDMEDRHLESLYHNFPDRGFAVKLENGSVITFVFTGVKLFTDDDGIASWNYEPTLLSVREHPECQGMKAIVFND